MPTNICRFADYELDRTAYQLRRKGRTVQMERIPLEVLFILADLSLAGTDESASATLICERQSWSGAETRTNHRSSSWEKLFHHGFLLEFATR